MTENALDLETQQSPWWLILLGGFLNIIIGVLLLTTPLKTVALLVFALGIYFLISGVFYLIGMFVDHTAWGWKLFMGVISIIAGILVIRNPLISTLTIPALIILLLGIQGIIVGIISLVMAFKGGGWGAGILGVLAIVFGVVLVLNWNEPAWIVTLVWVAGIFAVIGGIFQCVQAFRQRAD